MSAPSIDMGLDEWMDAFKRVCDEMGCEDLAREDTRDNRELERLFEEGRSPEEAMELLQFQ